MTDDRAIAALDELAEMCADGRFSHEFVGNYTRAKIIELLDERDALRDEVLYLRGYAEELGGKPGTTLAALDAKEAGE